MDQPRSIRFFHEQTGKYIGTLDNRGNRRFWDDIHEQDMDGTNYFNFFMPNNIPLAEKIGGRVRALIPHEETGWQEFIVHSTEDDGREREVRTDGAEVELNRLKVVEPDAAVSLTAYQYVELCTQGVKGYEPGIIEFSGSQKIDRSRPRGAYDYLDMVCTAFNLELRIRTETKGGYITKRYVDLLERIGKDRALAVEYGKDLVSFRKLIDSEAIVTSLYCQTPERANGTRLYTTVTHAEAFQSWNWQGDHLTDIYEPESDNQDMTIEQLRRYGQTALNKRVASIFEYDVQAVSVEHLFPHKKARLGDRINVKNTDIKPAIYARARVLRVIRSISNELSKRYIIGEIKEQREQDVLKDFRRLQDMYGTKMLRSPEPPLVQSRMMWIQSDPEQPEKLEIPHVADLTTGTWKKTSAKTASEIGGLELEKNYNGVSWSETEGIVVERLDGLVRTLNNATEGISIEARGSIDEVYSKVLYLDIDGKIKFKGDLEGAGGFFSGALSSGDGLSQIRIENGRVYGGDHILFGVNSVLPELFHQYGTGNVHGKIYTHYLEIPVSAGTYSPGNFIEVDMPVADFDSVAMAGIFGVFMQSETKEWYAYERRDSRVFTQGELSALKVRISPSLSFENTGMVVPVSVMVVGYR